MKPTKRQLTAVLENLQSNMLTASVMLKKYELKGASDIVQTWIEGINEKK